MISADLGKTLESYVQELVEGGRYGSKSEVLREGIRLIQERETQQEALKALVMQGMADIEAGRTLPAEDVFSRLKAKYQTMADKS
ncbi:MULTISPECIES: type II toxin-antitoxin system ParD family antitoxin [unclassified Acinetobacter]|uniref:type II toxin-antitoxin system ParD family antitoxin n=1 Tax=unclassified Acinetobacter TaxID=196816 RepID=UPI00124C407C|nr:MULTISPECIES: type II toxin-antitoxin system ParD family antitoxin [unclassified Acinetobacter]